MGDSHRVVLVIGVATFVVCHTVAILATAPVRVIAAELVSIAAGGTVGALLRAAHRARLRVALRVGRDFGCRIMSRRD